MAKTSAEQYGPDTISKFVNAAPPRIREARLLASGGFHLTAIYLCGYSIVMVIKAAFFKNLRLGINDEIGRDLRNRAMARARQQQPPLMGGDPHDVAGWARLLVSDRRLLLKPPYEQRFGRAILTRAVIAHELWRPQMRYRSTSATDGDYLAVRSSADWFVENYARM